MKLNRDNTYVGTIRIGGYDVTPPDYCTEENDGAGSLHNTPYCQPCEGSWTAGKAELWCGPSNSCAEVVWCKSDWEILTYSAEMLSSLRHCCEYKFGLTYTDYEVVAVPGTEECIVQYYGTGNEWRHPMFECYADLSDFISGCMDSSACNYDPTAQFDDGSCYSGDCINDWYMPGYENTWTHLLSIPIWIDGDSSNDNLTFEDVFGHLCEEGEGFSLLGEGVAAMCMDGNLIGSLTGPIDPFAGYWFSHENNPGPWEYGPFDGTLAWNNNMEIPLHSGNNLMSFPVPSNQPIPVGEAVPNTSDEIYGIVGQLEAALWSPSTSSQAPVPGTGGGSVYDICSGQVDDTWPQITDCLTGCYGEGGLGKQNECGCNSTCDNEMGDDYSCNLDFDMSIQGALQTFFVIDHTQLKIFPEWAGEDSSGDCVQSACVDTFFVLNSENFQLCGSRCGDSNSTFVDIACRHDSEPGWGGPTEVRIFLQRALDGEIYEIFRNPACPDYNDPFIHSGGMLDFQILCGPAIAIPAGTLWESGYWMGSMSTLEFGRGYWVVTNNDIDDFNWMGYGNDPRGAKADFHKVDLNMPPLNKDTNINRYIDKLCERYSYLSICNTPGSKPMPPGVITKPKPLRKMARGGRTPTQNNNEKQQLIQSIKGKLRNG